MTKNETSLCLVAVLAVALTGSQALDDALFQTSTIDALMTGVFDGTMSFKDLKAQGDFGIGTLDRLDGEVVGLDGEFYQIDSEGHAHLVDDSAETPFAEVAFFKPDRVLKLNATSNLTELESYLDDERRARNLFYAIRIDGTFDYARTRSPPAQDEPFPTLTDALKEQRIFEFHNVTGTLVGFWCPDYARSINVPGYHMHFITEDRTSGGHLLDMMISNATIQIDDLRGLEIDLPECEEFLKADLSGDLQSALEAAESNPE